ncbi:MAG: NUDIX domain-containing protein, partial [Myxococcales bacterium]
MRAEFSVFGKGVHHSPVAAIRPVAGGVQSHGMTLVLQQVRHEAHRPAAHEGAGRHRLHGPGPPRPPAQGDPAPWSRSRSAAWRPDRAPRGRRPARGDATGRPSVGRADDRPVAEAPRHRRRAGRAACRRDGTGGAADACARGGWSLEGEAALSRQVASAVWLENGRVFLSQRDGRSDFAHCWELSGGKVEPGESHADTLRREVEEEVGVIVRVVSDCLYTYRYPGNGYLIHFYGVERVGFSSPRPLQVQGVGWFDLPLPTGLPIVPSMVEGMAPVEAW